MKYLLGGYWRTIRDVKLNKEGVKIGSILEGTINHEKIYYTYRTKDHFYRKGTGFALNSSLIPYLFKHGVRRVVIDYHGERGRVLFISHLADWIANNERIDYVKDRENVTETYGNQAVLDKRQMTEVKL